VKTIVQPALSGLRFQVCYRLEGDHDEAFGRAEDITLEQTVEFPGDLLPDGDIRRQIVGRIEEFSPFGRVFRAVISYAMETAGGDLVQLLNVVFGNISIKPGVRVEWIDLPEEMLAWFKGPRFGIAGLREKVGVPYRPLLCTALKPMGLGSQTLAEMAYQFALGGVDLIKDDHGINAQPFSPFRERVERCSAAVARANRETGGKCLYLASLAAPAHLVVERAHFVQQAGGGGVVVMPGLVGLDTMRLLAEDDGLALPIMAHPAFQGSLVTCSTTGISHGVIFGMLARLAGADATIFPNYGGRFAFSKKQCEQIVTESRKPLGNLKPVFPAAGGGMTVERLPEMRQVFGNDVIFLIGGGMHRLGPDLKGNARHFKDMVERF